VFGLSHYAYKENKDMSKGVSEKPELVYKDFPDLVRYLCIMNPRYIEFMEKDEDENSDWSLPKYPGRN
jgi:hypothetical protein